MQTATTLLTGEMPRQHPQSGFQPRKRGAGILPRAVALLWLFCVLAVVGFGAATAYYAFSDSFIAPAILSPDSDAVLMNKLRLGELELEKARAAAEMASIDVDVATANAAVAQLEELKAAMLRSVEWTANITSERMTSGAAERQALLRRKDILTGLLDEQRALADRARADVEGGVISRTDYAKEMQSVGQIELALLENERAIDQSELRRRETALAQQALSKKAGVPLMPELLSRQEQTIRVDLEIARLKTEARSKAAQRRSLQDRAARIDELATQLRARPASLAAERTLDVAFVPYTQMKGVEPGSHVYSCVWGIFFCQRVGRITDVVPGEVAMTDPWGNQARGLYAVLGLDDREAAKSKTLRVRPAEAQPDPGGAPSGVSRR